LQGAPGPPDAALPGGARRARGGSDAYRWWRVRLPIGPGWATEFDSHRALTPATADGFAPLDAARLPPDLPYPRGARRETRSPRGPRRAWNPAERGGRGARAQGSIPRLRPLHRGAGTLPARRKARGARTLGALRARGRGRAVRRLIAVSPVAR